MACPLLPPSLRRITTTLLTASGVVLITSSLASSQENAVMIEQVGDASSITLEQTGGTNAAEGEHEGRFERVGLMERTI